MNEEFKERIRAKLKELKAKIPPEDWPRIPLTEAERTARIVQIRAHLAERRAKRDAEEIGEE